MFGYVKAFKPYMRMFEYDIYKAVYCGLCKDMGKRYGFFTRFTLSYDITFLALIDLSLRGKKLETCRERCIAHPFKKSMCAACANDFGYSSSSAVILTYHKLKDDIADKGFKGKAMALITLPFFRKPYKKASAEYPELAVKIESAMKLQDKLEKRECDGIDIACEPTAKMMTAVFGELSDDEEKKALLERFGYLLGRFIYITDALDDLQDDLKKGSYNPILISFGIEKNSHKISQDLLEKIYFYTDDSINLTLGELAEVYVKLDFKRYRDILDNIVYLGLKNVYKPVKNKKNKREENDYEQQ